MAYMERKTRASANHIITSAYEQRAYQLHLAKLRAVKAKIDNKPAPRPTHMVRNRKKELMMEGAWRCWVRVGVVARWSVTGTQRRSGVTSFTAPSLRGFTPAIAAGSRRRERVSPQRRPLPDRTGR
jgi:hypothetical protein